MLKKGIVPLLIAVGLGALGYLANLNDRLSADMAVSDDNTVSIAIELEANGDAGGDSGEFIDSGRIDPLAMKHQFSDERQYRNKMAKEEGWQTGEFQGQPEYYYPNNLVVMLDPEYPLEASINRLRAQQGIDDVQVVDSETGILVVSFTNIDQMALAGRLEAIDGISSVEPNYLLSLKAKESILQKFSSQYNNSEELQRPVLPTSRANSRFSNSQTKVCFVDSGVDLKHEDLVGAEIQGISILNGIRSPEFNDEHGHGTAVVSAVAAQEDRVGIDGLSPGSEICMAKIFGYSGYAALTDVVAGISWAVKQSPDILNLSFGTYADSKSLERIVKWAKQKGVLVVAAAGNVNLDMSLYPAAYPEVVSVGSHGDTLRKSKFSNWGKSVDFYAPGESILLASRGEADHSNYNIFSGTSISSSIVSGLLASGMSQYGLGAEEAMVRLSNYTYLYQADIYDESIPIIDVLGYIGVSSTQSNVVVSKKERNVRVFGASNSVKLKYGLQARRGVVEDKQVKLVVAYNQTSYEIDTRRIYLGDAQQEIQFEVSASELIARLGIDDDASLRFSLQSEGADIVGSELDFVYTPDIVSNAKVTTLSFGPANIFDPDVNKYLYFKVSNTGNAVLNGLNARVFAIPAVHEGVPEFEPEYLGDVGVPSLEPEQSTSVELNLERWVFPEANVTFRIDLFSDNVKVASYMQGVRYAGFYGNAMPQYNQANHRRIVNEAVKLLKAQGIYIPDLHSPNNSYLGSVNSYTEWPTTFGLPSGDNIKAATDDYYDDTHQAKVEKNIPGFRYSLINGAHDADGFDVAFAYDWKDNFDSHFWMDDSYDDDGLNSLGNNHHSALTKIKVILGGREAVPEISSEYYQVDDALFNSAQYKLKHGAIEHYRKGHKAGAWYLLGHALHLVGDLSVPSHVDDNAHGVTGATYHNWIDSGNRAHWNYLDALDKGGYVDPYQAAAEGEPIRFIAYSLQQLAGAYPWAATNGTQIGRGGNRVLGGEGRIYSEYLNGLMSGLHSHPLDKWHVNKDEVYDNVWKNCQLVDWIGLESRADCYDHNGHIDRDNTDDGGTDSDGDMSRIGDTNYTYAIRATAGMIYYFAQETGQLYYRVMPAINMVILN